MANESRASAKARRESLSLETALDFSTSPPSPGTGGPKARSSSGEGRIRVPFFSVVDFSRGSLSKKGQRAVLGDLEGAAQPTSFSAVEATQRGSPQLTC